MAIKLQIAEYGEIYRTTFTLLRNGRRTIVVRGIFMENQNDHFHVRVLKGLGLPEDEDAPGQLLEAFDAGLDLNEAIEQGKRAAKVPP